MMNNYWPEMSDEGDAFDAEATGVYPGFTIIGEPNSVMVPKSTDVWKLVRMTCDECGALLADALVEWDDAWTCYEWHAERPELVDRCRANVNGFAALDDTYGEVAAPEDSEAAECESTALLGDRARRDSRRAIRFERMNSVRVARCQARQATRTSRGGAMRHPNGTEIVRAILLSDPGVESGVAFRGGGEGK